MYSCVRSCHNKRPLPATKKYWSVSYIMVPVPLLKVLLHQLRFTWPRASSVLQASFVWKKRRSNWISPREISWLNCYRSVPCVQSGDPTLDTEFARNVNRFLFHLRYEKQIPSPHSFCVCASYFLSIRWKVIHFSSTWANLIGRDADKVRCS
jgi:hypothetical protein